MTYGSWRHDQPTLDLLAADLLPACPVCGDLCAPSATVCECGARLTPRTTTAPERASLDGPRAQGQKEAIMAAVVGCTCGGRGLCTQCVLAEYEGDPFVESTDRALRVLDGHGNVVDLHSYSKKVRT